MIMSVSEGEAFLETNFIERENVLMENTIENLDEEKANILTEILRCNVCLELPEEKQVKICEKGHHFCWTCHKKLKVCGVCRGKLLDTRNFVVEQLVTKLGSVLGISGKLPPVEPPPNLSPGVYNCLHQCQSKMPAYQMLSHLREKHSNHLIDNVRSNPFSKKFSFTFKLNYNPNEKFIWSTHISDMGLFTVELTFLDMNFFGCVRVLGDTTISSMFRYQLVVKIPNEPCGSLEFSLTDCPVSSYLHDIETIQNNGGGLKIKKEALFECINPSTVVTVFFSIWKTKEKQESQKCLLPSLFCPPERNLFFNNNRKMNRNRNRNMRRKRLKEKLKNSVTSEKSLTDGMSSLTIVF